MLPLRFIDVKADVGKVLNFCADDSRIADYVNRACERLLYELKSKGTLVRYRVCVPSGCLVWPRSIETIEAFAICKRPGTVRNSFYEFLGSGPGILGENSCAGNQLVDQGEVCSFDNVRGTGKKIAVYCDSTETTLDNPSIIIQYYDSNGQWVRVNNIDGEQINFLAAGQYALTGSEVMPDGLVKVIKPKTNGVVRLYEYDTVALTYRPLAYYEPSEEVPVYRSSLIPNLSRIRCCGSTSDCDTVAVTILAKLRFIPVENDNDFLVISHREAIRLAAQAVSKEQKDLLSEAIPYWGLAIACLKKQVEHYEGAGAVQPINMIGASTFGAAIPMIQ